MNNDKKVADPASPFASTNGASSNRYGVNMNQMNSPLAYPSRSQPPPLPPPGRPLPSIAPSPLYSHHQQASNPSVSTSLSSPSSTLRQGNNGNMDLSLSSLHMSMSNNNGSNNNLNLQQLPSVPTNNPSHMQQQYLSGQSMDSNPTYGTAQRSNSHSLPPAPARPPPPPSATAGVLRSQVPSAPFTKASQLQSHQGSFPPTPPPPQATRPSLPALPVLPQSQQQPQSQQITVSTIPQTQMLTRTQQLPRNAPTLHKPNNSSLLFPANAHQHVPPPPPPVSRLPYPSPPPPITNALQQLSHVPPHPNQTTNQLQQHKNASYPTPPPQSNISSSCRPLGSPPPPPGPTLRAPQQQQQQQPHYPIVSSNQQLQHLQQQQYVQQPPPNLQHTIQQQQSHPTIQQQQQQQQQQHQPQYQQQQQRSKIDPSQIPRPCLFTFPQQQVSSDNEGNTIISDPGPLPVYYTKSSSLIGSSNNVNINPILAQAAVPPQANTRFAVVDDGFASPNLIRSTVYSIPMDRSCHSKTGDIPLGLVCTPLAVHSSEFVPSPRAMLRQQQHDNGKNNTDQQQQWHDVEAIPLVNLGGKDPLRCGSCSAYVNPSFSSQGSCNMCGSRNRSLSNMLQNLQGNSPILQLGTVEYEVSGNYNTRETPVQPFYLYALDLTCPNLVEYLSVLETVGIKIFQHFQRQSVRGQKQLPTIGVCWFSANGIIIPNLQQHEREQHNEANNTSADHDGLEQFMIVSDVYEEPFCPIPTKDWTFDISTSNGLNAFIEFLHGLLSKDHIQWMHSEAKRRVFTGNDGLELSCGGAALAFIADALQTTGGRGTVITWRRPNFGAGRISYKQEEGFAKLPTGSVEDCTITVPLQAQTEFKCPEDAAAAKFYKKLQALCTRRKIALDIVLHTPELSSSVNHFFDVATLGTVCKVTSGRLIWIQSDSRNKNKNIWHQCLEQELSKQVHQFCGWDAVFRVRCSDGIRVKSFLGRDGAVLQDNDIEDETTQSLPPSDDELEIVCVTPTTCLVLELEYRIGGIPKDRPFAFVQTATLYTDVITGDRRLRVSTLAIKTTSNVNEVYKSVDFSAFASFMLRSTLNFVQPFKKNSVIKSDARKSAREYMFQLCVRILSNYKLNTVVSGNSSGQQLLLPEKMQLLPLFCMGLLKSCMLRKSIAKHDSTTGRVLPIPTPDERSFQQYNIATHVTPSMAMLCIHPNVFALPLSPMPTQVGQWINSDFDLNALGYFQMPPNLPPSIEIMQDDLTYLIDDGLRLFLYIGKDVPDETVVWLEQAMVLDFSDGSVTNSKSISIRSGYQTLYDTVQSILWQIRALSSIKDTVELRPTWPMVEIVRHPIDIRNVHTPYSVDHVRSIAMVLDATATGDKDYVDFLCSIHQSVRNTTTK